MHVKSDKYWDYQLEDSVDSGLLCLYINYETHPPTYQNHKYGGEIIK